MVLYVNAYVIGVRWEATCFKEYVPYLPKMFNALLAFMGLKM